MKKHTSHQISGGSRPFCHRVERVVIVAAFSFFPRLSIFLDRFTVLKSCCYKDEIFLKD